MDIIVDTQIVSYQFKGLRKDLVAKSLAISSITANEFLQTQRKNSNKPEYYIMHPNKYPHLLEEGGGFSMCDHFKNPKWAKMGSHRTDQVIIDFGTQFSAYREFGNEAISEIINENKIEIYKISVSHLPKQKQKYLIKRLSYILNTGYHCYCLTQSTMDKALSLFSEFISQHKPKDNVRNTINDILILATAIDRKKELLTQDNLLNRFAATYYEAPIQKQDENELLIDFSEKELRKKRSRESQGYINRGWSYAVYNN